MLTQLTTALTSFITQLYATTGLAGIVLAMAIESCCIPLPSEIVMPLAGVMIVNGTILRGVNPWVSLILVALAGAVGCLLGSIAAYGIGYRGGRPLLLKYGRYLLISQHDADKADRFFQRWGSATAFFSRLLPVVRTYISLPAGISKMPFVKFCIYTILGSFPWCLLLAYVGYTVGNHLDTLAPIFHGLDVVIVIAVVVLVALYIWRHIRNDRKARASGTSPDASFAATADQPGAQQNGWPQQPQPAQPQWGQQQQPSQQQWNQNQAQFPQSQSWGQQPPAQPTQPSQPQWGQPPSQPLQQWGQGQPPPPPTQPQWRQPQPPSSPPQQWPPQQPVQQWGQQQQVPPQPQWNQEQSQPPAQPQRNQGQPQSQQWGGRE